jgi:acetyl-CoA carboxylase alpha subunit
LEELRPLAPEELKRSRYQKFREMGKPE